VRQVQQQFAAGAPWLSLASMQMDAPVARSLPAPMSNAILVITDMQEGFREAAEPQLLREVIRLIDIAMAENRPLAILEWEGWGATLPAVRERLAGYGNAFTVLKQSDGGAESLLAKCACLGLRTTGVKYIVCGVSINACVRKTVAGLAFAEGRPSVDVITEACGDHYAPRWDEYPDASHVRLMPSLV
jgi:hypothetical protein